jgi:broad specificity phosphatase PhoE
MSCVYFVRHGQAGLRHDYDSLSEAGREQARRLGAYLGRQRIRFSAAYAGSLRRQAETAALALESCAAAGVEPPELVEEPRWNEFDLEGVMAEVVPLLCADDPEFRRQYEALSSAVADHGSDLHRRWTPCDTAAMDAWMEGRYRLRAESWPAFLERVAAARATLAESHPRGNVVVFTSALPISLCVGVALELSIPNVLRLAGAMYNSAITILSAKDAVFSLLSFNATPHLDDPALRSFR